MKRALAILLLVGCGDDGATTRDAAPFDDAARDADADPDASTPSLCPTGMTLIADRTSCPTSTVSPPQALLDTVAQPGAIVSMAGLDEGTLPCAPTAVCAPTGSATLFFSDDPEAPSTSGVLYADTVGPGRVRVYVYHVNAGASARKFSLVALAGASDVNATVVKEAVGTPGAAYVAIGKQVAAAWMASTTNRAVTIAAGQRVLLSTTLDAAHATTNQLVHAIIDIDLDAPAKISVVSVLANDDAVTLTGGLSLLPYDGAHDRGTFPDADLLLETHAGGEGPSARHIRLGGNVTDADLVGRDATRGADTTLRGNYGVAYRFDITTPDALQLAASARGGTWAGALAPPVIPLGPLDGTTSALWLGTTKQFQLIGGGGSSLPIDVIVLSP
ncbi:hypothetical protein BH11MYX2_BH11MYX2_18500 [soil metagenome]